MSTTVRGEVFDEYFSLTIVVEQRFPNSFCLSEAQLGEARRFTDAFSEVIGAIQSRKLQDKITDKWTPEIDSAVEILCSGIWTSFNEDVLATALEPASRQRLIHEESIRASAGEEILADFRGFLLSLDVFGEDRSQIRRPGPDTDAEEQARRLDRMQKARDEFDGDGPAAWVDALFPLLIHAEAVEFKKQAWATNSNERRQHTRSPFEVAEYTWSLFDSGRALYGSGFGPQVGEPNKGSPLQYVLLFAHDEHRAIGRVVNRLHTLGTLRLAALLDFDRVIHRDRVITRIDAELNAIDETDNALLLMQRQFECYDSLHAQLNKLADLSQDKALDAAQDAGHIQYLASRCAAASQEAITIRESIRERISAKAGVQAHRDQDTKLPPNWPVPGRAIAEVERVAGEVYLLATHSLRASPFSTLVSAVTRTNIQKLEAACSAVLRSIHTARNGKTVSTYQQVLVEHVDKALYSMSDKLRLGIEYRADRSKYYRERFEELSKAMYIGEVAGYQRYDEFVKHRMDRAFSLVTSVALRFGSVQRRFLETKRKLAIERSSSATESIERIQRFGEYVLFLILIPYYLGHLLYPVVKPFFAHSDDWPKLLANGLAFLFGLLMQFAIIPRLERHNQTKPSVGFAGRKRKSLFSSDREA